MLPLIEKNNHIAEEEETHSADKDDWTPDRMNLIQPKIHSLATNNKNGPPFYMKTVLVNNRPIKLIIDTGSPVTLIPKSKFNKVTTLKPITVDYRDVNDIKIKFEGKSTTNVEMNGTKHQLEILVTTRNTHPLLGLDWMGKLGITLEVENPKTEINHITKTGNTEDRDITTLKRKFHKLFNENHTVNNIEVYVQLRKGAKLIQQKGRPIPIHLQPAVEKEIEKLKDQGHIEKANDIDETCFVSPAVITIKKDKPALMRYIFSGKYSGA